jgi:hypothetical protein
VTEEELLYIEKELGLPNTINLFKISLDGLDTYLCSDFREVPVWWNSQQWLYCPLVIEDYRFSEENSSLTPVLSIVNLATLYSDAIANLPELEGAELTFFTVYETEIKASGTDLQSSLYSGRFKFSLTQLLTKDNDFMSYRIEPIGLFSNKFAPTRTVLRDGIFNMAFPGAGESYQK